MTSAPEQLRLNTGTPLGARELRAEQANLIETARLIHRAALTPGIADGLEVAIAPATPYAVTVEPGVALDDHGRVIVLAERVTLPVAGAPSPAVGVVHGNYLAVEHAEHDAGARLRLRPRLRWLARWPLPGSGQVVLAQAELGPDGAVRAIVRSVRRPVRRARAPRAIAYDLSGSRDVAAGDPKRLVFHVRGGRPDRILLTLRGARFGRLHYTQLGGHTHEVTLTPADQLLQLDHDHRVSGTTEAPGPEPEHRHAIRIEKGDQAAALDEEPGEGLNEHLMQYDGSHIHQYRNVTALDELDVWRHDHTVAATQQPVGADELASLGNALGHPADVTVTVTHPAGTLAVGPALAAALGWARFGDGTAGHPLVSTGTGQVDLLRLGVPGAEGEYRVEIGVPAGGGRIHYGLGVE